MNIFGSFFLAAPVAILSVLAVPLLVLAYMKRRTEKQFTVSTLYLLKQIPQASLKRARIKLPLRFYLELLALLLLVLAATLPQQNNHSEKLNIVIDNSMSMVAAATLPIAASSAISSSISRLDEAITAANTVIGSFDGKISVYTTSPVLKPVSSAAVTIEEAKLLLKSISPTLSADNLSGDITVLADKAARGEKIVLFTDRELDTATPAPANLTIQKVGNPLANVAIVDMTVDSPEPDNSRTVKVEVVAGGAEKINARLQLYTFSAGRENSGYTGEIALDNTDLELITSQTTTAQFKVKQENLSDYLRVQLSTDDGGDSISADNSFITAVSGDALKILFISASTTNHGLERIPGTNVKNITPDEYSLMTAEQIAVFDAAIFYKWAPRYAPKKSSLFILPPVDGTLFPVKKLLGETSISSWTDAHPIVSYLRLQLMTLPSAEVLADLPWATSIVRCSEGPLFLASEIEGIRLAAAGFEILPFEGKKSPLSSILTLNTIRWLSQKNKLTASLAAEDTLLVKTGKSLIYPDSSRRTFPDSTRVSLSTPGIYQIDGSPLVVNILAEEESRTWENHRLGVIASDSADLAPEAKKEEKDNRWPPIIFLALAVLFLEHTVRPRLGGMAGGK
ncbi:MAG: BatA domain-containing protein [bacterium]|nr:BatA domain-containing protein [bacterium]